MARPPALSPNADPVLLGAVLVIVAVLLWLAHRNPQPTGTRWLALSGGILLLAVAWLSPLGTLAEHYLVAAHLLQSLLLMGPVAALLLVALPRHPQVRPPWLVSRGGHVLVHPVPAILAVNLTFIVWHLTGPYDAALHSAWLYDAMELSLLLASVLFWWPIVTPLSPPGRSMSAFGKLGYIVLATIPQTFGGLLVALAGHVLYPGYGAGPGLVGLDPMTDQQIAGVGIALVSKIALLAAFAIVFANLLNTGADEAGGDDGGEGGSRRPTVISPRPGPSGVPEWVGDVRSGRTVEEPPVRAPIRVPAGRAPRRE